MNSALITVLYCENCPEMACLHRVPLMHTAFHCHPAIALI